MARERATARRPTGQAEGYAADLAAITSPPPNKPNHSENRPTGDREFQVDACECPGGQQIQRWGGCMWWGRERKKG